MVAIQDYKLYFENKKSLVKIKKSNNNFCRICTNTSETIDNRLVNKKQLGIIFLLAKLYIYKALVNNTPLTFTAFQKFSNKNMRNNNIWQLSPLGGEGEEEGRGVEERRFLRAVTGQMGEPWIRGICTI